MNPVSLNAIAISIVMHDLNAKVDSVNTLQGHIMGKHNLETVIALMRELRRSATSTTLSSATHNSSTEKRKRGTAVKILKKFTHALPSVVKITARIALERFKERLGKLIRREQASFRRESTCVNYTLRNILKPCSEDRGPFHRQHEERVHCKVTNSYYENDI